MEARLYANLTTGALSPKLAQGTWSPPKPRQGDDLVFRLALAESVDGVPELATRVVSAVKGSLGKQDARPESGTCQLAITGVTGTTADIAYDVGATALAAALNALDDSSGIFPIAVEEHGIGAWLIVAADKSELTLTAEENALWPISFVTADTVEYDEGSATVLRFRQTPFAASVTFDEVAPAPPVVSRKQAGSTDTGITRNEIQRITLPPDYAGAWQLKRGFRKTRVLVLPLDVEELQTTLLEDLADPDTGEEFRTLEGINAVYVEFTGDFAGVGQDLLEVVEFDPPPPDIKIVIATDTAEMAARMWVPDNTATGEVKIPLNLSLWLEDRDNSEIDRKTTFFAEITFQPAVNAEADNVAPNLNWNQPISRRGSRVFSPSQLLIGHRNYEEAIGDGVLTSHAINHGLAAAGLHVTVRENVEGGVRIPDSDYTVTYDSDNALTLSGFGHTLTTDEYIVHITGISHDATYAAHENAISEIYSEEEGDGGLELRLTAIEEAVAELQVLAPVGNLFRPAASTPQIIRALPPVWQVLRSRITYPAPDSLAAFLASPPDTLRDGRLLPAVHDAAAESLDAALESGALPAVDTSFRGRIFHAATALPSFPGGGLRVGDSAACDGREWYRVTRPGETASTVAFVAEADDETLTASAAHGLVVGDRIQITALVGGTGLTVGSSYWVLTVPSDTTLTIGATPYGSAVNITVDATTGSALRRLETGSSYYPAAFEVELFREMISADEFPLKSLVTCDFGIELALRDAQRRQRDRSTSAAHWVLMVAFGEIQRASSPGTPGSNLESIRWNAPVIASRIELTPTPRPARFAVAVERSSAGDITCEVTLYRSTSAATAPTTANFALRAWLGRFDVDDDSLDPRGIALVRGPQAGLDGQPSTTLGRLVIGD